MMHMQGMPGMPPMMPGMMPPMMAGMPYHPSMGMFGMPGMPPMMGGMPRMPMPMTTPAMMQASFAQQTPYSPSVTAVSAIQGRNWG